MSLKDLSDSLDTKKEQPKQREQKPFENLYDFCARVDLSKVDKRGIEPLIKCGAMDSFNFSRKEMLESLEDAMKYAKQNTMTQESGISDLFGGISESNDFIPVRKDKYDDFANSKFEFSAKIKKFFFRETQFLIKIFIKYFVASGFNEFFF